MSNAVTLQIFNLVLMSNFEELWGELFPAETSLEDVLGRLPTQTSDQLHILNRSGFLPPDMSNVQILRLHKVNVMFLQVNANVDYYRVLTTSTTTAGQAEAGSLKTSTKFCFEMASIELGKKNLEKRSKFCCGCSVKSLQVNFEAKVFRHK